MVSTEVRCWCHGREGGGLASGTPGTRVGTPLQGRAQAGRARESGVREGGGGFGRPSLLSRVHTDCLLLHSGPQRSFPPFAGSVPVPGLGVCGHEGRPTPQPSPGVRLCAQGVCWGVGGVLYGPNKQEQGGPGRDPCAQGGRWGLKRAGLRVSPCITET